MLRLARLACLLGAFAFAGPAFSQTISNATPTAAAVGMTLDIHGSGFGTAKPKVQLLDSGTGKKYSLKVVDFSDTQIHATITKAVQGNLTLQVIVKGAAAPANGPTLISIERPLVTSLSASSADPNAPVTIFGDFFGIKKGKVLINGKGAKVVSWAMNEIHILVPKKLPEGFWTLAVDNKLGVDDGATLQVTNSPIKLGKSSLTAFINGSPLKVKFGAGVAPGGYGVAAVGSNGSASNNQALVVAVPFFTGNTAPMHYSYPGNLFVVSYVETKIGKGSFSSKIYVPSNGYVVNITAKSGGQVAGDFSGTLQNQLNASDTIECHGNFIVDITDV